MPASVVDALGLKEGDGIEIYADQSGAFSVSKKPTVAERIESLRKYRGRLPAASSSIGNRAAKGETLNDR